MKAKKTKKAPKKQKFSFILTVCLLLVAGYFIISLINTQMDIKDRKNKVDELNAQYEQQVAENERLQDVSTTAIRTATSSVLPVKSWAMLNRVKRYITI